MIRSEIKKLIKDFHSEKNLTHAKLTFPLSFTGFAGHFPSSPVLPAVCQIQCIFAILSEKYGKDFFLKSISKARFLNPVFPMDELTIEGSENIEGKTVSAKFTIRNQDKKVSIINLTCIPIEEQR